MLEADCLPARSTVLVLATKPMGVNSKNKYKAAVAASLLAFLSSIIRLPSKVRALSTVVRV
jgi:hypothetical protein